MQARKADLEPVEASQGDATEIAEPRKRSRVWVFVLVGIVLAFALYKGIGAYSYARSHVSTDDAFLTADLTQVASQVSGTVEQVYVQENQPIRAGQLLIQLDDSSYRTAVLQAKANVAAAIAARDAAYAEIGLSRETSAGQATQALGSVEQAESGVESARSNLLNAEASVEAARATESSLTAQAKVAEAAVEQAVQARLRALEGVEGAKAQLASAEASLASSQATVKSATARRDYAASQASRMKVLSAQGAISRQQAEAAEQDLASAEANLQSAQQQVAASQALISQRRSELQSAKQGIAVADAGISQARAQANAARQQVRASSAGIQQALARQQTAAQGISQAQAQTTQALGAQHVAQTGNRVVAAKTAAAKAADAKVEQAQAALASAQLDLKRTRIVAPIDGVVSKRAVQTGALVQPGTPLLGIVRTSSLYVLANFKETQTAHLQPNDQVEVDVDGFPDHGFKAVVTSLSPATGATFALLPPDNSSGNFVKVVQRIPVRLDFVPGQRDLDRLKAGMSASVSVSVR